MEIQFTLNLVELKHAVRRLLARLPDELEAADDSMVFKVSRDELEIVEGGTSEILVATVVRPGQARVPHHVFRGIARSLQFHRGRVITMTFSTGAWRIDRTYYRHPKIFVVAPWMKKPAKLQNL